MSNATRRNGESVITDECIYCGADLRGKKLPNHLRKHCPEVNQ